VWDPRFWVIFNLTLASHGLACHGQRLCLIPLAEMGLVHAFSVFDF
jgi:hypothetical protein